MEELVNLGNWTEKKLDSLLIKSSEVSGTGERIDFLSRQFLDTPYQESTLIGNTSTTEVFVINLEYVDCFTFIDYVEAMRLSKSFNEFRENLERVRYQNREVQYEKRNHFFSDWLEYNSDIVEDATAKLNFAKSKKIAKKLNEKEDEIYFLSGIPCRKRQIIYLPTESIDDAVTGKLKIGDYIGIYSDRQGLDVSHVGILIRDKGNFYFRHASGRQGKVLDEDFRDYIKDKPGIIAIRPRN